MYVMRNETNKKDLNMNFERKNFRIDGMYVTYAKGGSENAKTWGDYTFVARFKYTKRDIARFVTFLINNFTVEEYFEAMENNTPVGIMKTKGYLSTTVRRSLKECGYPQTIEGYDAYINAQVEKYSKGQVA